MKSTVSAAVPALLFGLRLAASVCLSLYVAFWLQLDNPYWAAASAAAVSQPSLGASLRKGWYRMVGTVVGAIFIVALTACFVQNRAAFFVTLALWGAGCACVATVLHNFSSYAAALAGYTAAIVASDQLGATGGPDGNAFMFAVTRASEICIGIVCAGVILAATDFGGARRRLASLLAEVTQQVTSRFVGSLGAAGPEAPDTQPLRREFLRQVIALDPTIEQAIGESSQLRQNSPRLQRAVLGLVDALAGWRNVASHLVQLSRQRQPQHETSAVLQCISQDLCEGHAPWLTNPASLLQSCQKSVRALLLAPVGTPSHQLLTDQTAKVLMGIAQTLRGLALLVTYPALPERRERRLRLEVPDWAPALTNAARAFIAIGAAELFWVVSAWPSGAACIIWTAITVVLFGPRADQAYAGGLRFLLGTSVAALFAAIVKFAVLPQLETFSGFGVALACYLVPVGALSAIGWQPALFIPMAVNFVPLLAPANLTSYDTVAFYNSSLALVAGSGLALLAFRVLPPLSPAVRTGRLLTLTLRDLRRLARGPIPATSEDWERRIFARIAVLPDSAQPLQRAQMVAALTAGTELTRLHRLGRRLHVIADLGPATDALARGRSAAATAALARLDRELAGTERAGRSLRLALHARGSALALSEVLDQHAFYFDAGAPA
jgi:uncharacterized membrane protein YccC